MPPLSSLCSLYHSFLVKDKKKEKRQQNVHKLVLICHNAINFQRQQNNY